MSAAALALNRLRWDLSDVAALVAGFRRPHEAREGTRACLGYLRATLSGAARKLDDLPG